MSLNSPFYPGMNDDMEFEDDNNEDMYYEGSQHYRGDTAHKNHAEDSDDGIGNNSDTDEASEAEFTANSGRRRQPNEPMEIKEQMYQDKLASLKRQLDELKSASHPEFVRRVKKLDYQYRERLRLNEIYRDYLVECVERDYVLEKKAAGKEYEEKKTDLKENLLTDFEDKRKMIESERHSMELSGDTMDVKPTITRKLRRRPNDPIPVAAEKRRKPTTGQLVLLLDDKEVDSDLKLITRGKPMTPLRSTSASNGGSGGSGSLAHQSPVADPYPLVETKIEDGKLLYERRWFHRGQPVYVEGKDMAKFPAHISSIGNEVIWVKKVNDNSKVKISTFQLARGKMAIKRRAN